MDHGSSHVYMYENSDEEVISDGEYNEGMWLSDSGEEEVPALSPYAAVHPRALSSPSVRKQLEASASKYQHLPNEEEETSEDEEEEEEEEKRAVILEKEQELVYADLKLHKTSSPPKTRISGDSSKKNYVTVKHNEAALNTPPPPPPPPPPAPPRAPPRGRVQEDGGIPRIPPIPPRRGIIKNRIAPGLRKMRRQRVKWEQPPSPTERVSHRARRADTNVLAVKFNTLTGPSHVHTGDAVVCSNHACTAILSHHSQLRATSSGSDGGKEWPCEFCGCVTEVDLVEEEKPTKEDTTYLITPASVEGSGAARGVGGVDDAMVVFCIDISGSMCVSTEVPGKFELKGQERIQRLGTLNVDRQNQYLPSQRRDVTYISRLQAVQAAVDHQLTALSQTHPTQRVALITFGDEVTVVGDGKGEGLVVAGDKLYSSEQLVRSGTEAALPLSVKDTCSALSRKVFDLEEAGQTALGPALLTSVSMASRTPGSKVIICTDGLANKGVGSLAEEDTMSDEAQAEVQTFYEDLGTLALERNVTVSLVSIKGTDCRIMELGQVADKTGGQVTIVDPLNVTKEFSSILANPVIATDVTTKIILHRDLYFRTEESKESRLAIPVGNVTAQTELTYEYGVRRKERRGRGKEEASGGAAGKVGVAGGASPRKRVPPLMVQGRPHLPFQLQIKYTARDGSRCMRVITQSQPVTTDRDVAERDIDIAVVGTHVAHSTAALAMEGEYSQARLGALSSQRLLQKASYKSPQSRHMYNNLMEDLIPLENELRDKQQSEVRRLGRRLSDENLGGFVYDEPSELMATALAAESRVKSELGQRQLRPVVKKKKAISRRKEVPDQLATYCYQMKSSRSSDYDVIQSRPQKHADLGTPESSNEEED